MFLLPIISTETLEWNELNVVQYVSITIITANNSFEVFIFFLDNIEQGGNNVHFSYSCGICEKRMYNVNTMYSIEYGCEIFLFLLLFVLYAIQNRKDFLAKNVTNVSAWKARNEYTDFSNDSNNRM